jgi:hypothetical protein
MSGLDVFGAILHAALFALGMGHFFAAVLAKDDAKATKYYAAAAMFLVMAGNTK